MKKISFKGAILFFACLLIPVSLTASMENQKYIEPLFSDFVAEVRGINLRENFSQNEVLMLKEALAKFCVLVFKNQSINHKHLIQLARIYGTPSGCDDITNLDANNQILDPNSFEARQKKGNELWHIDMPMGDSPALVGILYAVEIPNNGGETEFVDLSRAFQNLPMVWQDQLKDKYAIHDLETLRKKIGISDPNELTSSLKPGRHPVICIDPFSGKQSLMISAHTRLIEGFELSLGQDQDSILAELLNHMITNPYTHQWEVGDVVLWNNRRCMHRVLPYASHKDRRRLMRVEVVGGPRPTNPNLPQRSFGS
jgi:alpha-ketoglutarate-dependent 2,4-dichlorophenoxyacetate dioxygenase